MTDWAYIRDLSDEAIAAAVGHDEDCFLLSEEELAEAAHRKSVQLLLRHEQRPWLPPLRRSVKRRLNAAVQRY